MGEVNTSVPPKGIGGSAAFFIFNPWNIVYPKTVALVIPVQIRGGCILLVVFVLDETNRRVQSTKWLSRQLRLSTTTVTATRVPSGVFILFPIIFPAAIIPTMINPLTIVIVHGSAWASYVSSAGGTAALSRCVWNGRSRRPAKSSP